MVSIGYNEIKRYKCISRKQDHLVVSSVTFQIYVLYHAVHYVTSILRGFQNDTHTNMYKVLCYFQSPYMSRHESPLTTSPEKLFFDRFPY